MTCRISAEPSFMSEFVLGGICHLVSEASRLPRIAKPGKHHLHKMLRKNEQTPDVNLIRSVI